MALGADWMLVGGGLGGRGRGRDVGMSWEAEGTAESSLDQGSGSLLKTAGGRTYQQPRGKMTAAWTRPGCM